MEFERQLFEETMRNLESRVRDASRTQEIIQDLSVQVESEDGLISMTVGPPGRIRELRFDPRAKRLDLETLAERIMVMVNDASGILQEELSRQIQSLMPDFAADEIMADFRRMNAPPETR
ncbi:YbaB/EbfC family nucleoid-associated protein [Actinoallomurus purpureus]|uniref:YbaB/EbfC family nucleoid-associated protein n=1 Tax=Actinoallomurus purpureus TaxID=478114 RepID=UPI0020932555|nr:YbaB/EbfC family nucleoid-associated protein [Actinoallomurus purpureus]MCO6009412.1 YbaB/EbfC family nucleoid-associated protein [Actinoallomurus purpureus]